VTDVHAGHDLTEVLVGTTIKVRSAGHAISGDPAIGTGSYRYSVEVCRAINRDAAGSSDRL
jgi:hypothetical protein